MINKPSRGLFVPSGVALSATPAPAESMTKSSVVAESDFYRPFAEWLKNDLDEVTDAAALGGASMGKKWGTPDVVGIYTDISHMTCSRDPRGMLNFIECHFITADGVCKLNSAMPRPDF